MIAGFLNGVLGMVAGAMIALAALSVVALGALVGAFVYD